MPLNWKGFVVILIVGIIIIAIGYVFSIFVNSAMNGIQTRLRQSNVPEAERWNLQGSLDWYNAQNVAFFQPFTNAAYLMGAIVFLISIVYVAGLAVQNSFMKRRLIAEEEQRKAEESKQSENNKVREETQKSTSDAKEETDYAEKLRSLAVLFADGKISEESYLQSVKILGSEIEESDFTSPKSDKIFEEKTV